MEFQKIIKKTDLAPGTGKAVNVNGKTIAVFNRNGEFYALDNACPHRGGPLSEGDLDSSAVTCPWHGWSFDLISGNAQHTASCVQTYALKIEGEDIFVQA